jgi:lipopolysaccharide export system ATP-binding protein
MSDREDRILEVKGLEKTYRGRRVVAGVSFHVNKGEIVGLLGANGAGKTTSFRMTCGMIEPDKGKGKVLLGGLDVTTWPMYRRAKEGGMGYLAQESSVFRKLTVEQNLLGVMELLEMSRTTRVALCNDLLDQFKITHLRKSRADALSGGERRRLEIARCLVSDPKIILLDEPFTGIDPVTIQSIQAIIRDLKRRGISILITDHQVRETLQITDRSYVVKSGAVLCHGSPAEVVSNPEARASYFGSSMDFHAPFQSNDESGISEEPASPTVRISTAPKTPVVVPAPHKKPRTPASALFQKQPSKWLED